MDDLGGRQGTPPSSKGFSRLDSLTPEVPLAQSPEAWTGPSMNNVVHTSMIGEETPEAL